MTNIFDYLQQGNKLPGLSEKLRKLFYSTTRYAERAKMCISRHLFIYLAQQIYSLILYHKCHESTLKSNRKHVGHLARKVKRKQCKYFLTLDLTTMIEQAWYELCPKVMQNEVLSAEYCALKLIKWEHNKIQTFVTALLNFKCN